MDLELDVCDALEAIRSSSVLRYILLSTVIWSIIAIPVNTLVIAATCQHNLIHYNIKWIVVSHLLCLIVHDIARMVNHTWDLVNYTNMDFDCSFIPYPDRCIAVRLPSHVTMYLSFSTTFMLSVERYIATFNLASYDKNRTAGPCLVFVQAVLAAIFTGAIYVWFELQQPLIYCLFASMTSISVLYLQIIVFLIFQVLAIIIFHFLMKYNMKIKVELLTRSKRLFSQGQVITKLYQVRENLRTMDTLFLFFLISCFVSFSSNALRGFVHYFRNAMSRATFIALIELSIPIPPYSVVLPAILWYSYRRVTRKIAQDHHNIRALNSTSNINRSHFIVLNETWR